MSEIAADLHSRGHAIADAAVHLTVTGRSDEEVALIRDLAQRRGFGALVLVDDHIPPRPGTVASCLLAPVAASAATEARATRILRETPA